MLKSATPNKEQRHIGMWTVSNYRVGNAVIDSIAVLHMDNFVGSFYDDCQKADKGMRRGQWAAMREALIEASRTHGLVIVQHTKREADGSKSKASYGGVWAVKDITVTDEGFTLNRVKQVAQIK